MEGEIITEKKIRNLAGIFSIVIDVLMIIIVLINLLFLIFDWCFTFAFFRDFVQSISNDFFINYRDEIHPNFLLYDSIFIFIFIIELFIQWILSIITKRFSKWWFYPFLHWYDVLGCIPFGAFTWLRLFRIFAMSLRLHKMGVVNLKRTYIYKQFYTGYQTVVQDITDRALIKLIEAGQRAVKSENKNEVFINAIKTDQVELSKALSNKIHEVFESNYRLHRGDMKEQIKAVIKNGFENSEEMNKLGQIPLLGNFVTTKLEVLINDISFQLADSLTSKLASDEVAKIIEELVDNTINSIVSESEEVSPKTEVDNELSTILKDILDRALQKLIDDIEEKRVSRLNIPPPDMDDPKLL